MVTTIIHLLSISQLIAHYHRQPSVIPASRTHRERLVKTKICKELEPSFKQLCRVTTVLSIYLKNCTKGLCELILHNSLLLNFCGIQYDIVLCYSSIYSIAHKLMGQNTISQCCNNVYISFNSARETLEING